MPQTHTTVGKMQGSSGAMKALRVLVVEDDMITGVLLGELLEQMGYDVCAIESTEADAVTAAVQYRPDLMIVDVQLGDGSGVSAVDEIIQTGPVPHFFVTADVSRLQLIRPDALVVQKPYRESDLADAIARALHAPVAS